MTGERERFTRPGPLFLVEAYWPGVSAERVAAADTETQRALAAMGDHGARYLGSMLVPGDELVLRVFAGGSPDVISEANAQAGVPVERVVEIVAVGSPT